MQRGIGKRGASARSSMSDREVAAGAVVAAADEREQALAGPARDVEDAAPAQPVLERERLEPLEPDVVLVVCA